MHRERGLQKEETFAITDVVRGDLFKKIPPDQTLFFNPIGMASFDIAIVAYYYTQAVKKGIGMTLAE
ncbi:hypothetical protein GCM10007416_08050 [Kroppenstedtia guangzhouensis]|uniref:Ornithine cyclodeaminase n=1 Tax=Kroppenstedtia guangzhouensis TaxID=1274356 RepID=A0ABQ1G655_9BACL|nr:hypothetical protein [Kroppenstedtia guangzhouensis]GGA37520.1 hypothetical protein GCM10007416_08050 [Kroppenstedtia guangzhouensis]